MTFNGEGNKFTQAMSSGLIATVAWVVVLITYCTFRAFGIEDPIIGQVFLLLTGAWVANLTLAQGKKQARMEETAAVAKTRAEKVERKVDDLIEGAEVSKKRADASEDREVEWSRHKDHNHNEAEE